MCKWVYHKHFLDVIRGRYYDTRIVLLYYTGYIGKVSAHGIFIIQEAVSYTHLDVYKRQELAECSYYGVSRGFVVHYSKNKKKNYKILKGQFN